MAVGENQPVAAAARDGAGSVERLSRRVELSALPEELRFVVQGLGDLLGAFAIDVGLHGERLVEGLGGGVVETQLEVGATDGLEHAGLRRRLAREGGQRLLGAPVEQLAGRDGAALADAGIDDAEDADQVVGDLGGVLGFEICPLRFGVGAHGLNEESHEEEGGGDARDAAQEEGRPVSPRRLAEAVAEARGAGADGQAQPMAPDVGAELPCGAVALVRDLRERFEHDGVQVPAQAPRQIGAVRPLRALGPGCARHRAAGRERLPLTNRLGQHVGRSVPVFEGQLAGEELVEHDAEAVDVRGGGDGLAHHLLRTGVGEGHRQALRDGGLGRRCAVRLQRLGDAEVEQLELAPIRDQDVARLQVAMHDEMLVGELHGLAQRLEQPEPRVDVELAALAVGVERLAVDVLHHQEGEAGLGRAAVVEAGDVRVLEAREDLPFCQEASPRIVTGQPLAQDLDGHLVLELAVRALGEEDVAGTARPEGPQHPVGAELGSLGDLRMRCGDHQLRKAGSRRSLEKALGLAVYVEELLDPLPELGIRAAGLVEEGPPLLAVELQGLFSESAYARPGGFLSQRSLDRAARRARLGPPATGVSPSIRRSRARRRPPSASSPRSSAARRLGLSPRRFAREPPRPHGRPRLRRTRWLSESTRDCSRLT